MKRKISDKQLRRFYRLLSVRMTDFDCGKLCAPGNEGIPHCCDPDSVVPLLYRDEYRWHRKRGTFWRRMKAKTAEDRRLMAGAYRYNVFARCPGPAECKRSLRALVCRVFPFEPYVDDGGKVLGLVYQEERKDRCALIGRPRRSYNPRYLANAVTFWQEVLDLLPKERKLYIEESRKRDRRVRRKGKTLQLFRATPRSTGRAARTSQSCGRTSSQRCSGSSRRGAGAC
jgi:hypothetical protein